MPLQSGRSSFSPGSTEASHARNGVVIGSPLLVTITIVGWQLASARDPVQTHTVATEGMKFLPGVLRIRTGDWIVFKNNDLIPHTAINKETGAFDSGIVQPGG